MAVADTPRRNPGLLFILAIVFLDMLGIGLAIPVTPPLVASYVGGDLSEAAKRTGTVGARRLLKKPLAEPSAERS